MGKIIAFLSVALFMLASCDAFDKTTGEQIGDCFRIRANDSQHLSALVGLREWPYYVCSSFRGYDTFEGMGHSRLGIRREREREILLPVT